MLKSEKLNNSLISLQKNKMPNHYSIVGCTSGYKQTRELMTFSKVDHGPTERIGLLTASRVMYEKHFHEDAMSQRLQRVNPIPTKRGPHCGKRQLNEPNIELWGKPL